MQALKTLRLVKNLNFKIGHAAIVLVEYPTGKLRYFDFGRYYTPRGYGRARSIRFEPNLALSTRASFNTKGTEITNISEILSELAHLENYTHGGGRLLCAITKGISYSTALAYAENLEGTGPIPYGALANKHNSCSRYVAQILTTALPQGDKRITKIRYPESLKASPTSNVVNAAADQQVYCFQHQTLEIWKMNRLQSFKFQVAQLKANFSTKAAMLLPADDLPGLLGQPQRPQHVPQTAQWLGGIGEGGWFYIEDIGNQEFRIDRYNQDGEMQNQTVTQCIQQFEIHKPYTFSYHFSNSYFNILQHNNAFLFKKIVERKEATEKKKANNKSLSI